MCVALVTEAGCWAVNPNPSFLSKMMLSSRAHKLFMQVKSGGLIAKLEDRDRRVRRGESQSNSFYGEVNLAYVA
jgi:hypothetical protein